MDILKAIRKAEVWMDEYEGVISVSEGEKHDKKVIVVYIKYPEIKEKLPDIFEGFEVVTELSDEFVSQK